MRPPLRFPAASVAHCALFLCLALSAPGQQLPFRPQLPHSVGGGLLIRQAMDCISPEERVRAARNIARYHAEHGSGLTLFDLQTPQPYPFHPQAGNLWDDLFTNNFVDLDPTSGILDWDNSDFTYDGHRGHDNDLRNFGVQDIGVPIFAALDGTVVDAHDGEFDKSTTWNNKPANYVILWHGGSHYTYYWHMRKNSVAVTIGQEVKAGTQLGLTGSSGISTGPHLHFESWVNGSWFEPTRACPGPSHWVHQIPVRRETYLRDFNVTDVDISQYPGLPYDIPRSGSFVTGVRRVAFWINLMNIPKSSTWRVRFIRPDGSLYYDSGTANFNNPYYRWSWWYWLYNLNLNVTGNWSIEWILNGKLMATVPFTVVGSPGEKVNRPPNPVTASLYPSLPSSDEVVFCRVNAPLLGDPDYDIVRYRYQWAINGTPVRDVVNAANSDALARDQAEPSDWITCTVTPTDGTANGTPVSLKSLVASSFMDLTKRLEITTLSLPPSTDRAVVYRITNTTQETFYGNIHLVLENLPATVTIFNKTGTFRNNPVFTLHPKDLRFPPGDTLLVQVAGTGLRLLPVKGFRVAVYSGNL